MTALSRRHVLAGAAATVAAAALPVVAVAGSASPVPFDACPWTPTTFYVIGDLVKARGGTYIATRNKCSPPFFTEHGFAKLTDIPA